MVESEKGLTFFDRIVAGIRELRIQGAEAVARNAIIALAEKMRHSLAEDKGSFVTELIIHAQQLKDTRPTEPMMRNELALLINSVRISREIKVSSLKMLVLKEAKKLQAAAIVAKKKIAANALKIIPENSSILIHCHSSTLIGALTYAFEKGKNFSVYCCETRPLYQGVKSARELSAAGIPTTLIVDSAANLCMSEKGIGLVLVGADAIDWNGNLFNKVGTSQIALAGKHNKIPVYSLVNSLKFDFSTKTMPENIEERSSRELFLTRSKFKVWNPAFDITQPDLIAGFVTEKGIVPPSKFALRMHEFEKKVVF